MERNKKNEKIALSELACKKWSGQQWEEYLSSIEISQKELLVDDYEIINNLSEERHKEGFSNLIGENFHPELKRFIDLVLNKLSPLQKKVLHYIFWEGLPLSDIATMLGVSKTAVIKTRDRGLVQLGKHVVNIMTPSPKVSTEPKIQEAL